MTEEATTVTPVRERNYSGEWCKRCDRRVGIGFNVSNDAWEQVVGGRFNVVCFPCFDELAQEKRVFYELKGAVWPVTWHGR